MQRKNSLLIGFLCLCFALTACSVPEQSIDLPTTPPQTEEITPPDIAPESPETPETPEPSPEIPTPTPTPDVDGGTGGNGGTGGTGGTDSITPPKEEEDNANEEKEEEASYILCTGQSVNIRSGAGGTYSILGQAEAGTMYATSGKTGNWYKIFYKNKEAYLSASYAQKFTIEKSEKAAVEEMLKSAYFLLGVPYVYGAVRYHDGYGNRLKNFTKNKFDCSSLTQYAFYMGAGVLLQTTTRTQVKQGKYVSKSKLQRGDCIYFTNEARQHRTGVERVGHVAIYLGDNYILHTSSDYARIEKMTAYRWNFYIESRRFI